MTISTRRGGGNEGFQTMRVTVDEVDPITGWATVTDSYGGKRNVLAAIRRGGGRMPLPGETWILDRTLGDWTFAALVSVDPTSGHSHFEDNLISNGDFELGMAPHIVFDDGPGAVWQVVNDPQNALTGGRVLRLDTSALTGATRFMLQGIEHLPGPHVRTHIGDQFRFSFWVRSGGGASNRVRARTEQWRATGHLGGLGVSDWVTPGPNWQEVFVVTDQASNAARWVVFDIEVEDSGNTEPISYYDRVAVTKIPPLGVSGPYAPLLGLSLADVIYYTTPGADTFEKADFPGLRAVLVEVQGAGGAGGGATATGAGQNSIGQGGGGGAYARKLVLVTDLDESEAVVVGAGGTGNSGAQGDFGGDSSFDTIPVTILAPGGGGGTTRAASTASGGINASTGEIATGGDLNFRGGWRGHAQALYGGVNQFTTGDGGASYMSPAHVPGRVSSGNGFDAVSGMWGAGGSGAGNGVSQLPARTGGAGGDGIVIVWLLKEV